MQNYTYANSCKPSSSMLHPVECANFQTPMKVFYVRSGPLPDNADEKTYDLGNFNIATEGLSVPAPTDQQSIGELWATFEIEFFKPKFDPNSAEPLAMDHFKTSVSSGAFNTVLSKAFPFGNLSEGFYVGNIGTRIVSDEAGNIAIQFPPGSLSTGECFQITYIALMVDVISGSASPLSAVNLVGFQALSIITQTPTTPLTTGTNVFDATALPGQTSNVNCTIFLEATEADLDVIRNVTITGFASKYSDAGQLGQADIYVVKIPTRDISKPLAGPQNLTLFGLG